MKIALLVPNYEGSGGVRTVADFLNNGLKKSGHETHIFSLATSFKDSFSRRLLNPISWLDGIQLDTNAVNGQLYSRVGCNWAEIETQRYSTRQVLTKSLKGFDVVQVVAGTPAWACVCENIECPIILQVATLSEVEREQKMKGEVGLIGAWKKIMSKKVSKLDQKGIEIADAIMVENNWMYDYLSLNGYKKKVHFAPPGVDTSIFKPHISDKLNQSPYLLSVGRFDDPRKDITTLFKAYALLKENYKNTPELILAGKRKPTDKNIELAKSLGIWSDIQLKIGIPLNELVQLYQNAELFVLSSREEGLGMVIMEAMACGTAVVSTDSGGPSTLIESDENGELTEVGNPKSLSNAIEKCLSDKKRVQKYQDRSLELINSEFQCDKVIHTFLNVYNRLVTEGGKVIAR